MDYGRLQVAIWFLMPIVALLLLVLIVGFRLIIVPSVIALIVLALIMFWRVNRGRT